MDRLPAFYQALLPDKYSIAAQPQRALGHKKPCQKECWWRAFTDKESSSASINEEIQPLKLPQLQFHKNFFNKHRKPWYHCLPNRTTLGSDDSLVQSWGQNSEDSTDFHACSELNSSSTPASAVSRAWSLPLAMCPSGSSPPLTDCLSVTCLWQFLQVLILNWWHLVACCLAENHSSDFD